MIRQLCIPLDAHLNAGASTRNEERAARFVNPWGNSFPAEELPFGRRIAIGEAVYDFPMRSADGDDHIELLGQTLEIGNVAVAGVAALGFAVMGARPWSLTFKGPGESARLDLIAPGWAVEHGTTPSLPHLGCTHLHYVGGYELDHLRPCAWSMRARLDRPIRADRMILPEAPLVHLFAITIEALNG